MYRVNLSNSNYNSYTFAFKEKQHAKNNLDTQKNTKNKNDKLKAFAGGLLGTSLGLLCMMKKQKVKNPFKVNYALSDMCMLSAASIAGSVSLSMIGNNFDTNKKKFKEGIFQFSNATIPTWLAGATLALCEASPKYNNAFAKSCSTIGAILVGMYGAAGLTNKIFDPKDLEPDRKLTLKDGIVNLDDIFGILVLAKIPFLKNLHIEKALPAIYTYCGYKAGKTN